MQLNIIQPQKEQNNSICSNMAVPKIFILSIVRQRKIYDIAYIWNLKKGRNELILKRQTVTNVENKFMVTRREAGQGDWE